VVDVLDCLKKYGQRLDLEIARETGVPLQTVRERLAALAATGAIITCSLTRFEKGKRIDAWTLQVANAETRAVSERLLGLKVDQITTDDPEGLVMLLTGA